MSFLDSVFGARPEFDQAKEIDLGEEQRKAIKENVDQQGKASELAGRTNRSAQAQLLAQLEVAAPGFGKVLQNAVKSLEPQTRGELPEDISRFISDRAAASSFDRGFGIGSGQRAGLTARDLGRTSLDISNQAGGRALQFLQGIRSFGTDTGFSATQLFISPTQRAQTGLQSEQLRLQQENMRAKAAAMRHPAAQFALDLTEATVGAAVGAVL